MNAYNLQKIGITERGDAGIDLSWSSKMNSVAFAIIITKSVNDKFIKELLKHKGKVILHATVTGYGGTVLEPNVHDYKWSHAQVLKLIEAGFEPAHIVLRVDPVIATTKGNAVVDNVLGLFEDTGVNYPRLKSQASKAKFTRFR